MSLIKLAPAWTTKLYIWRTFHGEILRVCSLVSNIIYVAHVRFQKNIALFNFGGSIQRRISTFYVNTEIAVLNNGFCKLFSLVKRSETRLPSVSVFIILAAELLACKIRQDKKIQGINIFGQELKLSQFADDTTLFNSKCNSIKKAIAVLDNFGDISGLKLNPSKTEALWLGLWRLWLSKYEQVCCLSPTALSWNYSYNYCIAV